MDGDICLALIELLNELDGIWGDPTLGLALSASFFLGVPRTASELGNQLGLSDDTVRRLIKPLVNVGRATVIKEGRSVRYTAVATWAKRTRDRVVGVYTPVS